MTDNIRQEAVERVEAILGRKLDPATDWEVLCDVLARTQRQLAAERALSDRLAEELRRLRERVERQDQWPMTWSVGLRDYDAHRATERSDG